MGFAFNPFTGNFDVKGAGGGGGSAFFAGEVATYADLPLDGTAALDSRWLVRSNSGTWPFSSYKQAGVYVRIATVGSSRDNDYRLTDTSFHDVMSDSAFLLYDDGDATRNLKFQLSGIDTATTRTLTVPNASGRIQVEGQPIGNTTPAAGTFTTLTAQGDGTNALVATFGAADGINNEIQIWGNGAGRNNVIAATVAGVHFRVAAGGSHCQIAVNATTNGFRASANAAFHWSDNASNANTGTSDLFLRRDAANTLAQYNSTSPQTFRLYNTFTDASNHERGFMRWSSNVLQIGTEKAGTGSARNLDFVTDGTTHLTIDTSGHLFPPSSNSRDIGTNSLRFRWGYFFTGIALGATSTGIGSSGDGLIQLRNNNNSSFGRLQFGGTTSSFPALKRDSTALQVRLADDSAYSVLDAQLRAQGTAPATSGAAGTAGDIRYDADYIYVCTAASTWKRAAIATW